MTPPPRPPRPAQRVRPAEIALLGLCFVAVIGLMLVFVSQPVGWTVFGVCAVTVLVGSRFVK